jgi:ATP-binding cassette, subfamily B, bacterial
VCFQYAGTSMTLDRVSFRIPRGASVAFVGPSGSGKSTVLNLLMRFCDPSSGSILLDGVDLRRVRQASLRAQMGVVFQDPLLINASVRDNILLGRPGATDAEVEEAARSAELDAAIATFPQRYHTPAGERGGRLSGGQRQRLAIARALVRQPSILILDEATSALDAATESAINDTLRRVSQDRTVVAVTHRLASVVDMDWIVVLDGGHVVEQGTHATLLQQDGAYARLWARQHGVRVDAAGDHASVDIEWLAQVPLFAGLGSALLISLAGRFATERVDEGQVVVRQGEPAERFYVVARGKFEVVQVGPDGRERWQRNLTDGEYFGEIGLLRTTTRTATVRALTPGVLLSLSRAQFAELLRLAPGVAAELEDCARSRERLAARMS